ncbi:MAG: transcriptional regulator [Pseudomonadota bacterium]
MSPMDADEDDKYRAPALSKGLDILELLASGPNGLSQVEIAKTLGRTTSEIFRMLMVLRKRGYVELAEEADRYSLTTKLFELAHRHPPTRRLTSIAGDAMQRLANRVNQSMHMVILHSAKVLVIAQVDCQDNNLTSVRLGAHIPIFETSSGRVLAAWMDDAALADLLAAADPAPEARIAAFRGDLPGVRALGHCQSPSFTIDGVTNIAAPVFDFRGRAIAAITIPFVHRLTGTSVVSLDETRRLLLETCDRISRQIGAGAHLD